MNKLEKAAQDLLDVLAIAMPEVSRIIVMHTNRGGSYSGPNIRPQMDALEAALGAARPHIADEQLRKAAQEVADWGSHVEYINSSIKRRIDTLRSVLARQAQDGLVIGDEQLTDEKWKALCRDISDRRGLKWEWNKIDDDVLVEIRKAWSEILFAPRREPDARAMNAVTEALSAPILSYDRVRERVYACINQFQDILSWQNDESRNGLICEIRDKVDALFKRAFAGDGEQASPVPEAQRAELAESRVKELSKPVTDEEGEDAGLEEL